MDDSEEPIPISRKIARWLDDAWRVAVFFVMVIPVFYAIGIILAVAQALDDRDAGRRGEKVQRTANDDEYRDISY